MSNDTQAAHLILGSPQFATHPQVTKSLRDGYVDWELLLDYHWSTGERTLLKVAAELYTGRPWGATLTAIVSFLDDENYALFLDALRTRRGFEVWA